ncbi:hypothetical protein ACFQL4_21305 [Halosimplex aquaticum]
MLTPSASLDGSNVSRQACSPSAVTFRRANCLLCRRPPRRTNPSSASATDRTGNDSSPRSRWWLHRPAPLAPSTENSQSDPVPVRDSWEFPSATRFPSSVSSRARALL